MDTTARTVQRAYPAVRISVVGVSGSGKSTVARLAAARLGIPHIELDGIQHGPNWSETPPDEFRAVVAKLVAGDAWVIDGNYRKVRDLGTPAVASGGSRVAGFAGCAVRPL